MRTRKKKKSLIVFLVILAILLCVAAVGFFTVNHYLNRINRVDDMLEIVDPANEDFETEENPGLEEMNPEDVVWDLVNSGSGGEGSLGDEHLLNILLVGQDRRPGQGRQRSDSMIVCSFNLEKKTMSMISFLRDLYVTIPGYTDNRLNAAYVFGGFPLLKSSLLTNFGITIDACVEVDFNGFIALIDNINGVDINLTAAEAQRIGRNTKEGMNHLNGEKALAYARIRKIGTDFARTNRQRTVLLAAFDKIKDKSLPEILKLLDESLPYVTTDMKNADIYSLATKLFPMAASVKINTYYVPPENTFRDVYIRGMAVLYPDLAAIRNILKNEYLPF